MGIEPVAVVDEGLGNSCYLLDLGAGRALVVDPPRDLRAVRARAGRLGLRATYAADTHLHADFLSGARQLAVDEGATVLASAAGRRGFPHRGLGDGDEVDLGGLRLRALGTPGHTDEHLSFLLVDGGIPLGVFTGGSLIVGSAARTDLLGEDRAEELARAQYASLRRLAALPEGTAVWPTQGAGSFCSAPPGAERISTIGRRRPPIRCWASRTRTGSSASCSARWAATRRTSCGSGRSTATARPSSTPAVPGSWRRCRCRRSGGCGTVARS
jgi:hydroxyacylglutathione hydrolase